MKKRLIVIAISFLSSIFFSCEEKTENDQINITVKVIDAETKKPIKNDTIEVQIGKLSFQMNENNMIENYISDSVGETKIKLFKNEVYRISSWESNNELDFTEFQKGELEDYDIVTLEVSRSKD